MQGHGGEEGIRTFPVTGALDRKPSFSYISCQGDVVTEPCSLTHRRGRKPPSHWARQRTFRKAPGETVSAAHVAAPAAAIVDVDRATSWRRNTLPGFASAWETASPNESFGVQRLMAWHRQIPFGISRLAVGTRPVTDVDPCPTDSPEKRKRRFRIRPLPTRTARPPMPSKRRRETRPCPAVRRPPDLHGSRRPIHPPGARFFPPRFPYSPGLTQE